MSVALLALVATRWAPSAAAQNASAQAVAPVFRRAQQQASDGDMAGARAIVDSVLSSSRDGSPEYAEALFWHASFAASAEDARRDYLRLAVEYSLTSRAGDALVRLAQLELSTGNRAGAKKYLERLAREHPDEPSGALGTYWMGRVLLDEGAMAAGCASLAVARAHVASTDVELSNQVSYYSRQCAGLPREADTAKAAASGGAEPADHAKTAIGKSASETRAEPPGESSGTMHAAMWSAQVAAYSTKTDADRIARRLKARGYDVRVTREAPFRVRIGQFRKRADAAALAQKLRNAKMAAIIVESERP